jgi:hypothetical protein
MKLASRMPSPLFLAAAMQDAVLRRERAMQIARRTDGPDRAMSIKTARAYNRIAVRYKGLAELGYRSAISEASGLCSR